MNQDNKVSASTAYGVEELEHTNNVSQLSQEKKEFLIRHHKTYDLTPMPSMDLEDPLNWASWKKHLNLFIVSFHGFMTTFNAVSLVPATDIFAKLYDVDISIATYIGTCQLITLGLGPLFWTPLADRWGRLPIWFISAFGSALFNVACSECKSYASHMVFRLIQGFFLSPGLTLVQGVVTDMFFTKHKGQKMGIWVVGLGLGTAIGPLTMGYVAELADWRWVYRIEAIIELTLALCYLFVTSETLFRGSKVKSTSISNSFIVKLSPFRGRIDKTPLTAFDFVRPLKVLRHPSLAIVMVAYSVAHNFVLVFGPVEFSYLYSPRFRLDAAQVGLNYISLAIGLIIGEQFSGPLSDYFLKIYAQRKKRVPAPSQRLVIAQVGNALVIIGLCVFLVETLYAGRHWNVKPDIGMAFAAFGCQMVATPCITYISDKCPRQENAGLGVTINAVRLIWSFASPFWYPYMIESCGLVGSSGVVAGLAFAFTTIPLAIAQFLGRYDGKPNTAVAVQNSP